MLRWICVSCALLLAACEEAPESVAPLYDTAPLETRTIQVTVEAAGVIEPESTVEVKSKASGEILAVHAETGDIVEAGTLLVEVDKRTPRNRLSEAEAGLLAAQARRSIAETQMRRSETLYKSGTLTQTDFEQSQLEFANAQAQVVSSEVAVENARIAMDDTDVRAPGTGTIIEKTVEPGMVISSPTQDVSGGSILLKMADLTNVQVRTLVDETDIGKIVPGMSARVTVAAYPNQPFEGQVLKIEPLAIVESNVTRFAVLITIENLRGLLKPGMNAEVEIQIAGREDVSAVPTAALRTDDDIVSTAAMLGLAEEELRALLAAPELEGSVAPRTPEELASMPRDAAARRGSDESGDRAGRGDGTGPGDGGIARANSADGEIRNRGRGTGARGASFGGGRRGGGSVTSYQFGGEYWVIAVREGGPTPVKVRTGLTDLAFTEVIAGLEPDDKVLLLPSSSLYEQQARLQQFINERFSSTPFQQNNRGGRGPGRRFR